MDVYLYGNQLFISKLKKIMEAVVKGDKLIITLDFNKNGIASKSGKSLVHATTNGNTPTSVEINGKKMILGVNAYTAK